MSKEIIDESDSDVSASKSCIKFDEDPFCIHHCLVGEFKGLRCTNFKYKDREVCVFHSNRKNHNIKPCIVEGCPGFTTREHGRCYRYHHTPRQVKPKPTPEAIRSFASALGSLLNEKK